MTRARVVVFLFQDAGACHARRARVIQSWKEPSQLVPRCWAERLPPEIPEAMKPRAIPIASSGKVLQVKSTKVAA
jgi:hypothetical protein